MHSIRPIRSIVLILTIGLVLTCAESIFADEQAEKKDLFQPNAENQKAPAQNPLNPLKKIIQGWFGGPQPAAGRPANLLPGKKNPGYYRFPQDLDQERRFKRVQNLIDDQEWNAARESLQLMLENSLNLPIHVTGDRSLITDRELIYQLLELLPEEQQQQFNRQYDALAQKLLNEARLNNAPPESYAEIATRFSGTQAGKEAMNYLMSYHMERGEFGLAEQYLQRLLKSQAAMTQTAQWKTKAAYIFKQTGKESLISELFHSSRDASLEEKAIQIGGTEETPQSWLSRQSALKLAANLLLDEWPMLFGAPSHAARAKHADPLLIPRWSFPLTSNHSIQSQLRLIQEDLASAGYATVPALPPLATKGKIVFRTLKGIQVLDALTGTPLWELPLQNSPEESFIAAQLRGLKTPQARGLFDSDPETDAFPVYNGTAPGTHALTSLIYRNANWGSQSSDGRQLYVLQDMDLNLGGSNFSSNLNRLRRNLRRGGTDVESWSANQIVAYDLQTGQQKWTIGGTQFDEPFDLPLAGTFFMGAPTPSDNELFIVGERDREIRLYALNPQTGEELWSQQIGNPDQDIALDMIRRWWIAPVAVDQGVVVCPTTIGLVTAIDRLNHSILWSTPYTAGMGQETNHRFNQISHTPITQLNQRWSPSAPVIAGNKVVYTPPDSETLICLDLITGSHCWTKRAKETSLYLAGVADDQILLVGTNGATAISLKTGKTLWNTLFGSAAGAPAGQAVIADQQMHIPLQRGQIWTLDLKTGKVLKKLFNENQDQQLGNLIIQNGQFLSLSATDLISFEQKQTFENQIARIKQENPQDPEALLKESQMLMMSHSFPEALARLRRIDPAAISPAQQDQVKKMLIHGLASQIRSDFEKHDELVEQLQQEVSTSREKIELKRLLIERHLARDQYNETMDLILELADAPQETFFQNAAAATTPLEKSAAQSSGTWKQPAATEIQIDSWIAGQAYDLWEQIPAELRDSLSRRIADRARVVLNRSPEEQERFLQQFRFHEASLPVLEQVISDSLKNGDFHETELWLTQLSQKKQPELAARGLAGKVTLYRQHHLLKDAEYCLAQLAEMDANLQLNENQSVLQFLEQNPLPLVEKTVETAPPWQPQNLKLVVSNPIRYYSTPEIQLDTSISSLPYFNARSFAVDSKQNRLMVFSVDGNRLVWSTPLRSSSQNRSTGFNECDVIGHNLILQHRDMLHFIDLVGQKLVWSQKLDHKETNRYISSAYRLRPSPLGSESSLVHQHHPSLAMRNIGMIAASNADYTCFYSRRKIILVDTRTGKVRWTHENVDNETRVLGDQDWIYLVTRDRTTRKMLRVIDGQQVPIDQAGHDLENAIYQGETGFVSISGPNDKKQPGQKAGQISLYRFHSQSAQQNWNLDFPQGSKFGMFNQHYLSALGPKGTIEIVDLRTGKKTALDSISEKELEQYKTFYLVDDDTCFYLVGHSSARNSISVNVPSIPANGTLFVFDRRSGKRLWSQEVEKKHLVLNQQNLLPVVLLVAREYKKIGNRHTSIFHLEAVNKQSGKSYLSWEAPVDSNIRALNVDQRQKMIEILTYGARIRLYDADELASHAAEPPSPEKASSQKN